MLPPLASSLAYSNYSQWRASRNDQDLPEVTPGVPLTDFYRAAEREVRVASNLALLATDLLATDLLATDGNAE